MKVKYICQYFLHVLILFFLLSTGTSTTTFLDEMFNSLKGMNDKIVSFITMEEYDTDVIKLDVTEVFDGNINFKTFGQEIPKKILDFIRQITSTFNCVSL